MTHLYRISIDPTHSLDEAWALLEGAGIEVLYSSEEEGKIELFAHLPSPESLSPFNWIKDCSLYQLPPIDWEAQWAAHGHHFQDGYVHIDFEALERKAPILRLQPGSGFGDLSHPTTRLMLNMLAKFLQGQIVIDIGCGSGVLSLAAAAMGAGTAFGIDIDREAVEHSRQNAILNHLEGQCTFSHPSEFVWEPVKEPVLILMNMIQTEQNAAWHSLPSLHHQTGHCLTSGIRKEGRDAYLAQTERWGWTLLEERQEDDWLAFYFSLETSRDILR